MWTNSKIGTTIEHKAIFPSGIECVTKLVNGLKFTHLLWCMKIVLTVFCFWKFGCFLTRGWVMFLYYGNLEDLWNSKRDISISVRFLVVCFASKCDQERKWLLRWVLVILLHGNTCKMPFKKKKKLRNRTLILIRDGYLTIEFPSILHPT